MGECKLAGDRAMKATPSVGPEGGETALDKGSDEAMQVRTPGGNFSVRWDDRGSATALGQLAFFAEYLKATGLFEQWVSTCPLKYTSPNAPSVVDVLGTWMCSILDGHWRSGAGGPTRPKKRRRLSCISLTRMSR